MGKRIKQCTFKTDPFWWQSANKCSGKGKDKHTHERRLSVGLSC